MLKFRITPRTQVVPRIFKIRQRCTLVSENVTVSMAQKYCPVMVENGKYEKWEKRHYFSPKAVDNDEKVFSIILPPPNITGTLHLGHALTVTIEDTLCRRKRMQGYAVSWIPGTDHAGIATQLMVEKHVFSKTGRTRKEVGRNLFFEYLLEWKASKMNAISDQLKQLGASVNWSKYSFTMDPQQSAAVTEAIIRLYEDGLLFHDKSIVNWCCHLQSTISDIEIDHRVLEKPTLIAVPGYEQPVEFGLMYNFAMKIVGSNDDEIIVCTTRPETIFGDVAVAVHPNDSRYNHLNGCFLHHPFRQCAIPVIFDDAVDPECGTGAVKITPGHSRTDFEISQRHNLAVITVFDEHGMMNDNNGDLIGFPRFTARNHIISRLSDLGLLRDVKEHLTRIPVCSRSGDVVEKMIKPQWFLKCGQLTRKIIEAIENGELVIEPSKRVDTLVDRLKNMNVWCLSRQLWWGHRLPLYRVDNDWIAAKSIPEAKTKYWIKYKRECVEIEREKDMLDTWFSSALLPFSIFGWPQNIFVIYSSPTYNLLVSVQEQSELRRKCNDDFQKFYPLSLMETGADILALWVSRMLMLSLHFTNQLPFNKIFLHAMVCDNLGRKMSKSLGNVIEPNYIIHGMSLKELEKIAANNHSKGLISSAELQKTIEFQKEMFPEGIHACGADALRLSLAQHMKTDGSILFSAHECRENYFLCNKLWQASRFTIGWASKYKVKSELGDRKLCSWQRWLLHRLYVVVDDVNAALESFDFPKAVYALKHFLINDFCDVYLEVSKPVLKSDSLAEAEAASSVMLYSLETYLRLLSPIMPFITDEIYTHLPDCSTKFVGELSYPRPDEYSQWKNECVVEEIKLVQTTVRAIRSLLEGMRFKNANANIVLIPHESTSLPSYLNVIQSLIRCRSVEIRDQSADILGPTFVAAKAVSFYLVVDELTNDHLNANYIILIKRIDKLRRRINEKVMDKTADKDLESSDENPDGCNLTISQENHDEYNLEKVRLHDEWKDFEVVFMSQLNELNPDDITFDDIRKMTRILRKVHYFHERSEVHSTKWS